MAQNTPKGVQNLAQGVLIKEVFTTYQVQSHHFKDSYCYSCINNLYGGPAHLILEIKLPTKSKC